jgi:hypothetical protein
VSFGQPFGVIGREASGVILAKAALVGTGSVIVSGNPFR